MKLNWILFQNASVATKLTVESPNLMTFQVMPLLDFNRYKSYLNFLPKIYSKVRSTNTSHLEPHPSIYRLHEGEIEHLCTVNFWGKVDFLKPSHF